MSMAEWMPTEWNIGESIGGYGTLLIIINIADFLVDLIAVPSGTLVQTAAKGYIL